MADYLLYFAAIWFLMGLASMIGLYLYLKPHKFEIIKYSQLVISGPLVVLGLLFSDEVRGYAKMVKDSNNKTRNDDNEQES